MQPAHYFLPFHELHNTPAIVVDGAHKQGLVLSHWRGQNTIPFCAGDTSADVVFNALQANISGLETEAVTATHFDVDGFVGVWALFNREQAMRYEDVLRAAARIGDFREFDVHSETDHTALKLVCWINEEERIRFYPPYGEEDEIRQCVGKFEWFLPAMGDVLERMDDYADVWKNEYERVVHDCGVLEGKESEMLRHEHIGLTIIRTPEPLHYYALFGKSAGTDIVLTVYDNHRYELEYKYTTWVDITSRGVLPRINMQPLCNLLNAMETSGSFWFADAVTDTGPVMRLGNPALTKAQLFDNPCNRDILFSSIPEEILIRCVTDFFHRSYSGISPRQNWSWEEIRALNRQFNIQLS